MSEQHNNLGMFMKNTTLQNIAPLSTSVNKRLDLSEKSDESSAERMALLHSRLHQEADKIRLWKTRTEVEIRQKDSKIQQSLQTIDSLRKSIVELQIQNENLSMKLQDEIANRDEIIQKISATRDMCNLLKDYAAKVEDRLQKCETERSDLQHMQEEHGTKYEELLKQFSNLDITAEEKYNKLYNSYETEKKTKLEQERKYSDQLQDVQTELEEMVDACKIKSEEIKSMSDQLESNKENLQSLHEEYDNVESNLKEQEIVSKEKQQKLEQTGAELQAVKQSFMKEVADLGNEKDLLHERIAQQKEEICGLQEKNKMQKEDQHKSEEDIKAKTKELEQRSLEIISLEKKLTERGDDLMRVKADLEDAFERERESLCKIDNLKTLLETETDLHQKASQKLVEETQKSKDIQNNLEKTKKETQKIAKDLEHARKKEKDLVRKLENDAETIEKLRVQLRKIEEQIKQQNEEAITKIKSELSNSKSMKNDIEKKTKALSSAQEKLKDVQEKQKELKQELTASNKQLKEQEKEVEKLLKGKEITELENAKKIKDMADIVELYQKNTDSVGVEYQQLKSQMETAKSQLKALEEEKGDEIDGLRKEVEKLKCDAKQKSEELLKEQQLVAQFNEKEEKQTEKERKQAKEENKKIAELTKKEDKLSKQVEKLKEDLKIQKEKEKEQEKLKKEQTCTIKQIQKELETAAQEKNTLECNKDGLEKAQEEAREELDELKQKIKDMSMAKLKNKPKETKEVHVQATEKEIPTENSCSQIDSESMELPPEQPKTPRCVPVLEPSTPAASLSFTTPKSQQKSSLRNFTSLTNSVTKRRKVMFASGHSSMKENVEGIADSDSSAMMEVEINGDEVKLKNHGQKTSTTPLRVRPSPNVGCLANADSNTTSTSTAPKLIRGAPLSKLQQAKRLKKESLSEEMKKYNELFAEESHEEPMVKKQQPTKSNSRQTPSRSPGRFFKTTPAERKKTVGADKKKEGKEAVSWFDNDEVFGFGPED